MTPERLAEMERQVEMTDGPYFQGWPQGIRELIAEVRRLQAKRARIAPSNSMVTAMYDMLSQSVAPLHYTAIYSRLRDLGIVVHGRNPAGNVIAHLSANRTRFQNVGKGLWTVSPSSTLADRPERAAIDQAVLDAAEAWASLFSSGGPPEWEVQRYALYQAVQARRAARGEGQG